MNLRAEPVFEDLTQTIIAFVRENQNLALPVAFLVAFGESFCFLSVLWPGTAILVGIAGLFAASGISASIVLPMVLSAAAGGTLGYAVSYWIGYYFKDSINNVWPFSTHPDLIHKGEYFFQKYGTWSVFLGHFFGPVRAVIPVVAGMFAMRQIPFQIANVASAVIWAGGVIASAFYVVTYINEIFDFIRSHQLIIAALLFALAIILAIPYSIVFWPALAAFIILGFLQLYAGGTFWLLWLAGATGAIVGDIGAYILGAKRRDDLLNLRFLHGARDAVEAACAQVKAEGALAILPSKAGSMARALVPMLSGALNVSTPKFLLASVFSSLIWSAVLLAPFGIAALFGLQPATFGL